jgi:hypothetical protein
MTKIVPFARFLTLTFKAKKKSKVCIYPRVQGANFWLGVLSDLQNRGVKDILITSADSLTDFVEAIQTISPQTEV